MTQIEKQSVRNAEAAENTNRIPTFEEVYAMPYIQESIRSLLMKNSMLFPYLASYEDDLRQEMLIYLASSLVRYDFAKSDIKTFCRMKLETGLIRARRIYRSESSKAISSAVQLDALIKGEDEETGVSGSVRRRTECYSESPFEKESWDEDFQDAYNSLSRQDQVICDAIMDGRPPREMIKMGLCTRSSLYERALPAIRKAFIEKIF